MFDFNLLIGHEKQEAIELLNKNGYNNIKIKINSNNSNECNAIIVCSARVNSDGEVTLVCGEFLKLFKEI